MRRFQHRVVPFQFPSTAVGGSALKGDWPRLRRAKSRLPWRLLSLLVPAITQWSCTHEPRIHPFRPPRPDGAVSKTPKMDRRIVATNNLPRQWRGSFDNLPRDRGGLRNRWRIVSYTEVVAWNFVTNLLSKRVLFEFFFIGGIYSFHFKILEGGFR